jgi:hypothetical protein
VSVLEMDGQFDKLEELIYVESHLSNTSAKFYGEITQQMLKNSNFPGSNNGTGLLQVRLGKLSRHLGLGLLERSHYVHQVPFVIARTTSSKWYPTCSCLHQQEGTSSCLYTFTPTAAPPNVMLHAVLHDAYTSIITDCVLPHLCAVFRADHHRPEGA